MHAARSPPPPTPVPDRRLRRQPTALEAASGVDFAQIDQDLATAYDDVVAQLVRGRADLAATLLAAIRDMDAIDPLTLTDELRRSSVRQPTTRTRARSPTRSSGQPATASTR